MSVKNYFRNAFSKTSKFTWNEVDNWCHLTVSFISEYWYICLFFMLQMSTMKLTESTNICCTSDRLVCTINVKIKDRFIGNDGFLQMFMCWMDYSQRIKDLLPDKFGPMLSKDDVVKFCNSSWLEKWTFRLLAPLCSTPRGLKHNCKGNGNVWPDGWVINWAMWTHHNQKAPLTWGNVNTVWPKGSSWCHLLWCQKGLFDKYSILSYAFRAFIYLNLLTVLALLNYY